MRNQKFNITSDSRAIDIFRDIDFLRLFRVFILEYVKDNKDDKNIVKLASQFSEKTFLQDFQKKNNYNLFLQFEKFFGDGLNLSVFLEYLKKYDIDEKLFNVFLDVGNFLENISFNKGEYPKEFYSVSDDYKTKIVDIVGKKDLENIKFILAQEKYPLISPFGFEVVEADFGNGIDYQSLDGEDRFIWCKDSQNNIFYQNRSGEFLKDSENKRIIHIDVNSIKEFGNYRIYSFINEDSEGKIQIEPSLAFGVNFNNNIYGDSFNVKNVSYIEKTLGENNEVIEVEEKLDYLLINDGEYRRLLNKDLEEISILDLLLFLNKNNPLTKDNIEKNLDRLAEISVEDIHKIYNFNGVKFVELTAELLIGKNEDQEEIFERKHIILLDNGKPLIDNNDYGKLYIYRLGQKKKFFEKEFISFSLTQAGGIDGYIDSFGKIIKIGDMRLIKIEELHLTLNGEKFYKLNDNNNLVFSESYIKKELSKYDGFNENGTKFEIVMENGESIEFKNKKYEKLVGVLQDSGDIKFYLQVGEYKKEVEYNKLLKGLRKSEIGRKALSMLNKTLSLLEII